MNSDLTPQTPNQKVIASSKYELKQLSKQAREILEDKEIPSFQRLTHLKRFADQMGKGTMRIPQDQLRQVLWDERRKLNGSSEPYSGGDFLKYNPRPFMWEGIVMQGTTNLVVSLPKVGKSRLFTQMYGRMVKGDVSFLGQHLQSFCPRFLIVGTDQPDSDWALCLHLAGLLPNGNIHHKIVKVWTKGKPLHLDEQGIDRIAGYASEHPGLLILLDSYFACVSPLGLIESDSVYADPLLDLQEAIAPYSSTLVVIHHSNRGGAGQGASMSSRGTTALPAAVSQTINLAKMQKDSPLAPQDERIKLTTEGRASRPLDLLIEQVEEGHDWLLHGDVATVAKKEAVKEIVDGLNERQTLAIEDICCHWTFAEAPMDAEHLAAALSIEGRNPEARAREVLSALEKHRLVEKAGDMPAKGGAGGKPKLLYKPTKAALSLYGKVPSKASNTSNELHRTQSTQKPVKIYTERLPF